MCIIRKQTTEATVCMQQFPQLSTPLTSHHTRYLVMPWAPSNNAAFDISLALFFEISRGREHLATSLHLEECRGPAPGLIFYRLKRALLSPIGKRLSSSPTMRLQQLQAGMYIQYTLTCKLWNPLCLGTVCMLYVLYNCSHVNPPGGSSANRMKPAGMRSCVFLRILQSLVAN